MNGQLLFVEATFFALVLHGLEFLSASNEVAIGVAAFSSFSESDGSWCGFCARTAEGPLACLSGKKFKEAQEACHSLSEAEQENCLSSVNALKVLQMLGLDMSHWLYGFEGKPMGSQRKPLGF